MGISVDRIPIQITEMGIKSTATYKFCSNQKKQINGKEHKRM